MTPEPFSVTAAVHKHPDQCPGLNCYENKVFNFQFNYCTHQLLSGISTFSPRHCSARIGCRLPCGSSEASSPRSISGRLKLGARCSGSTSAAPAARSPKHLRRLRPARHLRVRAPDGRRKRRPMAMDTHVAAAPRLSPRATAAVGIDALWRQRDKVDARRPRP